MVKETENVTLLKQSARDYARIYKPSPIDLPKFAMEKFGKYKLSSKSMKVIRNIMRQELGYKVSE